ncbi:GNAT family N-acetyltransferase [Burkholderia oklahomensis]|uniref:GNAT family N-acetyltransferase n=1 Tax=Burkholderia oklahomensis TaxID=342113 RepID=UPI00016A8396|nr:GNAT family N-acetyltransferase [Burkholderia oklahomensis]
MIDAWLVDLARENEAQSVLHLLLFRAEDGAVIGACHFTNIVRRLLQACHLGFSVDQALQGRGLMQVGLRIATEHVFGVLRLHRIMANYRPENVRRGRLLARLGFESEGFAHRYLRING